MRMRTELIAGMAAGAVIGAIAGMVLAPKSGKVTRETLSNQFGRIKDYIAKNVRDREMRPVGARPTGEVDYLH